jgi:hypothetical protein
MAAEGRLPLEEQACGEKTFFGGTIATGTMVAEVPCNLTPRHPPSQVVDNLPGYGS